MLLSYFFCQQNAAYEMRISDWSSDVCSSDLAHCGFLAAQSTHSYLPRKSTTATHIQSADCATKTRRKEAGKRARDTHVISWHVSELQLDISDRKSVV